MPLPVVFVLVELQRNEFPKVCFQTKASPVRGRVIIFAAGVASPFYNYHYE